MPLEFPPLLPLPLPLPLPLGGAVYGSVRLSVSLRLLVSLSPREICVISTDSTDWLFLSKN